MKNKKKKGFTLVELIAVIAILGILATILVPNIKGYTAKANKSKAIADAKTIVNAVDAYNAEDPDALIEDSANMTQLGHIVGTDALLKKVPKEYENSEVITIAILRKIASGEEQPVSTDNFKNITGSEAKTGTGE